MKLFILDFITYTLAIMTCTELTVALSPRFGKLLLRSKTPFWFFVAMVIGAVLTYIRHTA